MSSRATWVRQIASKEMMHHTVVLFREHKFYRRNQSANLPNLSIQTPSHTKWRSYNQQTIAQRKAVRGAVQQLLAWLSMVQKSHGKNHEDISPKVISVGAAMHKEHTFFGLNTETMTIKRITIVPRIPFLSLLTPRTAQNSRVYKQLNWRSKRQGL